MDKATQDKIEKLFSVHLRGMLDDPAQQLDDMLSHLEPVDVLDELREAFFAGYLAALENLHVR